MKIQQDRSRFRRIVRGRIRENLRRYMASGELIGRQGGHYVSIPIQQIQLPRFRYGDNEEGGVGSGEGAPGDVLSPGDAEEGSGAGGGGGSLTTGAREGTVGGSGRSSVKGHTVDA